MKISIRFLIVMLAALVLFNASGIFVLTFIQTGIHRMNNHADAEVKETLLLSDSEFQSLVWIGKKDFIWNGKVYDCISRSQEKNRVRMVCAIDKKESMFRQNLGSHFSPNDQNTPARKSLRLFFKSLPAVPFHSAETEINVFSTELCLFYSSVNGHFSAPELSRNTPPPECC